MSETDIENAEAPDAAGENLPEGPAWEKELDVYPIRPPEEDPRWAMWVFWIWVIACSGMIVFMVIITFLGWYYD